MTFFPSVFLDCFAFSIFEPSFEEGKKERAYDNDKDGNVCVVKSVNLEKIVGDDA